MTAFNPHVQLVTNHQLVSCDGQTGSRIRNHLRFVVKEVDQPVVAAFYEHLIPEWEHSQTDPMHLVLLLRDIRHTLNSSR